MTINNSPQKTAPAPIIVAFDTVFEQCSLAISQGDALIYLKTLAGGRGQTETILPMLDEALNTAGLSVSKVQAWAFNRGPGAFSGIRINTAVVQALSVANAAPCLGISSLQALAFAAGQLHSLSEGMRISAIIDARQNEVYVGEFVFKNGQITPASATHEYLAAYDSVIQSDVVVGNGAPLVQTSALKLDVNPSAEHIARLAYPLLSQGLGVSAAHALPVYLRHNAWKTLADQKKQSTN